MRACVHAVIEGQGPPNVNSVNSIYVEVSVVLGRTIMPIHQLLKMGRGAVIALHSGQDEDVWLLANNKPVARGQIVIQNERIGISVTKLL